MVSSTQCPQDNVCEGEIVRGIDDLCFESDRTKEHLIVYRVNLIYRLGFELWGWHFGFMAGIWATGLKLDPQDWDLGLVVRWHCPRDWDSGLKAGFVLTSPSRMLNKHHWKDQWPAPNSLWIRDILKVLVKWSEYQYIHMRIHKYWSKDFPKTILNEVRFWWNSKW